MGKKKSRTKQVSKGERRSVNLKSHKTLAVKAVKKKGELFTKFQLEKVLAKMLNGVRIA